MKEEFEKLGIIFTDTDSALKEYPELFKEYFAQLVPPTDNKLAALNSAVWSGGHLFMYQKAFGWIHHCKHISGLMPKIRDNLNEH